MLQLENSSFGKRVPTKGSPYNIFSRYRIEKRRKTRDKFTTDYFVIRESETPINITTQN